MAIVALGILSPRIALRRIVSNIFAVAFAFSGLSCRPSVNLPQPVENIDTRDVRDLLQVRKAVESGLNRAFRPAGPQQPAKEESYIVVCKFPCISIEVLASELGSQESLRRANAVDYLSRLAQVKVVHQSSMALLRLAKTDESHMVRVFAESQIEACK